MFIFLASFFLSFRDLFISTAETSLCVSFPSCVIIIKISNVVHQTKPQEYIFEEIKFLYEFDMMIISEKRMRKYRRKRKGR